MKFSVLMSVYSKEDPQFLLEAIKSTINQSLKPDEIVIIQDGVLTSELNKVLEEFQNSYPGIIKLIQLETNMGLGKALEIGVEKCTFDLIARMDTDDISHPNRFEKQVNFMVNHPDVQVLGSWIGEFEHNPDEINSIRKVPTTYEEVVQYAKKRNPLNHMTVMYRKSAVLEAGNYKPFLWNEDYYLWVRMLNRNAKIVNMPEILVFARAGSDMFKRRGGFKYLVKDVELQQEFLKMNFIDKKQFITNIFLRGSVRILPNFVRGFVYKSFLRK
ncbi:glycosyltransferase [Neobacillus sp.]|uniref:glycosyltransferase n=1 Tax=Neobacillus sp. TaxID=2675273 RepID=UPI00289B26FB|nr:glycosyltransferase [Neobacillus sp.]